MMSKKQNIILIEMIMATEDRIMGFDKEIVTLKKTQTEIKI